MTDVFISYSRKDIAYARLLHAALHENDFETWIDWQDIPPTTDWINEIYTATGLCKEDTELLSVNGKELMKALEHNICTGFVVMREIAKVIISRIRNLQSVTLKTI